MDRPSAAALLVALVISGCVSFAQDAEIPIGLDADVESARSSLRQNEEGPIRSTFAFRLARCRADGGLLLIFDQRNPIGRSLAFTMRGPGASAGSWAGGFGVDDLDTEPEIVHFFAESPEVTCA